MLINMLLLPERINRSAINIPSRTRFLDLRKIIFSICYCVLILQTVTCERFVFSLFRCRLESLG